MKMTGWLLAEPAADCAAANLAQFFSRSLEVSGATF
jgi:hypothetical protein